MRALVLRMRSSGEAFCLGGLGESYSLRSASMLLMVFSKERTPRPASSSTFFTVFSKLDTLLTINWGGRWSKGGRGRGRKGVMAVLCATEVRVLG